MSDDAEKAKKAFEDALGEILALTQDVDKKDVADGVRNAELLVQNSWTLGSFLCACCRRLNAATPCPPSALDSKLTEQLAKLAQSKKTLDDNNVEHATVFRAVPTTDISDRAASK